MGLILNTKVKFCFFPLIPYCIQPPEEYDATIRLMRAQGQRTSEDSSLKLKLSIEHSGFRFEPNPQEAALLLKHHSGGKVAEALKMALSVKTVTA